MGWNDIQGNTSTDENKVDYVKFEEGKATVIRILDEEPVSKWRHWLKVANRSVTCCGRECPVCDSIKRAKSAGLTPVFSSTKKHTMHILNRTTGKVELLEQGKTFFDQLLVYKENMGDVRDYDIKVIRTGKEKQTTYTMIPMPASGLTAEEVAVYEANQVDIDLLIAPYTYEQTLGFMEGKTAEEIFKNDKDEIIEVGDTDIPY
jgi:hypothetical protein